MLKQPFYKEQQFCYSSDYVVFMCYWDGKLSGIFELPLVDIIWVNTDTFKEEVILMFCKCFTITCSGSARLLNMAYLEIRIRQKKRSYPY